MTRALTRKKVPGTVHRVVVIGAGLSGLAAAARLRASGREVTIIEAAEQVGGRCRTETLSSTHGTFEADTGATVLTMPSLVESTVHALGQHMPPTWSPRRLSPAYHAQFASGRSINVYADETRMEEEIRIFATEKYGAGHDARRYVEGYRHHRAWAQEMFTASYENFLAADFDSALDLVSTPASSSDLLRLLSLGAFGSLAKHTRAHIKDEELERLFTFQALYAGETPSRARAVYSVISHMDTSMGVYYPAHCIGEAAEAIAGALKQAGAKLMLGTRATRLSTEGDRVVGVEIDNGDLLLADAVIATVDLPILDKLVGHIPRVSKRLLPLRWSPSAVVVHGTIPTRVTEKFTSQAHHTMSFGHAWENTFAEITAARGRGHIMSDPSLLITRPAVSAPSRIISDANGESYEPISILAPTPNLDSADIDWDNLATRYVDELLRELESRGFGQIQDSLSIARIDTPRTWHHCYGYGQGSPFSLAHSFFQTGPFRPRNMNAYGLKNLVLAGSSTTPGVGVPTVLLSGALAARRITGGGVR
ncbi:phytoene desaturase [Corynebacterium sp. 4HC-13]|uniref:Phytoene desaturase n=2 Tax=Corynebacterium anserum TaxID=2684406 RepID=A0A7G7YQX9_9CORY|nr:phytoene desaturase family protein [Corynebacterium anserum]MBC2680927.1 phytoene desaturase [Corynebacterium anserum]QNH96899.1 phytoene desaturase [Corynebacterium anserum]